MIYPFLPNSMPRFAWFCHYLFQSQVMLFPRCLSINCNDIYWSKALRWNSSVCSFTKRWNTSSIRVHFPARHVSLPEWYSMEFSENLRRHPHHTSTASKGSSPQNSAKKGPRPKQAILFHTFKNIPPNSSNQPMSALIKEMCQKKSPTILTHMLFLFKQTKKTYHQISKKNLHVQLTHPPPAEKLTAKLSKETYPKAPSFNKE